MTRRALRPAVSGAPEPAGRSRAAERRAPARPKPTWRAALLAVLAAGLAGGTAAVLWPRAAPETAPRAAGIILAAPADEAALLAVAPAAATAYPFAPEPSIIVVLYPSLHSQALALNRIGAFVEKAGAPHDRVLGSAELSHAIESSGDAFDTYYFGHDYRAADLNRFFAAAAAGHVALNAEEAALRRFAAARGWLSADARGALISLPPAGATTELDGTGRAAILRHELSHGAYFTQPAYAAAAQGVWRGLDEADRAAFRRFLAQSGYDTGEDDLMCNETQAYLVHTEDNRFFTAAAVGLPADHIRALRTRFINAMPEGWLRARTPR